jgi:hypothetical protein
MTRRQKLLTKEWERKYDGKFTPATPSVRDYILAHMARRRSITTPPVRRQRVARRRPTTPAVRRMTA